MKKFALRHKATKNLLRLEASGNMDHSVDYSLTNFRDGEIWMVDTQWEAEYVRQHHYSERFEAYGKSPHLTLEPEEVEVVEVNVEVEVIQPLSLPSYEEVMTDRYGKEEPLWVEARIKERQQEIERGEKPRAYDLYQLKEFMRKKEGES